MDFLVTTRPPQDALAAVKNKSEIEGHYVYALEINLRQCGTTHPYFTMKFLTGTRELRDGEVEERSRGITCTLENQ